MNNFIKRTLSGFVFVVLVIGSILWNSYAFLAVFSLIAGLAVHEFHKLTDSQSDVSTGAWAGIGGAVLLFLVSFLHAASVVSFPVYPFYGFYVVLVLIAEH